MDKNDIKDLKDLKELLEKMLNNAPDEENCNHIETEIYADMQNLYEDIIAFETFSD